MAIYKSIVELIGNTPLLRLGKEKLGKVRLFAKLEYLNPFGSIKDRTAWGMIKNHLQNIKRKKKRFIEASSGNTIKALQALAGIFDLDNCLSITNRIRVGEIKDILTIMGTEIVELPGKSACIDPNNPEDPLYVINDILVKNKERYFYTNQYFNEENPKIHYQTTAQEIINDLKEVDYLFVSLGTSGSSRGLALRLKETNKKIKIIGIGSSKNDFIPGIRNENELLEVGLFEKKYYDEIFFIDSNNALDGMMELIRKYGVLAGPSSGAVYYLAKKYFNQNKRNLKKSNAVLILCDRFEWYISYIKERKSEIFNLPAKEKSIKNFDEKKYPPKLIKAKDLKIFTDKHNPIIIDIRSNLAYQFYHLPSSINIPEAFFEELIDNRECFPKEKKILIVCALGVFSAKYASYLRYLGYEAYHLEGGINNFKKKQLT